MGRSTSMSKWLILLSGFLSGCGGGSSSAVSNSTIPYRLSLVAGAVSGPVGSADGTSANAYFSDPMGVAIDATGNILVADTGNNTVRRISPGGIVSTWLGKAGTSGSANGSGTAATFNHPEGLAIDQAGSVYVADTGNQMIRKITADGTVTTLAGTAGTVGSADGTAGAAQFDGPIGLVVDSNGTVYVSDSLNSTIRKITPAGVVTTLAGQAGVRGFADGMTTSAQFNNPQGLAIDQLGNLYVADTNNHAVRMITPAGLVTTLAGSSARQGAQDGPVTTASFDQPVALAVTDMGTVWVVDRASDTLRAIHSGMVSTLLSSSIDTMGMSWSSWPVPAAMTLTSSQQPVFVSYFGVFQGSGF